jgi:transposase-like protein
METPKTLLDAITFFAEAENCRQFMIAIRWNDGIVRCPHCGSEAVTYMAKSKLYFCKGKHPRPKFSLKVGTIFEDSPIGLEKWLPAFWLITNCKNGISSYELARAVGVTQKTGWFMLHRIREVLKQETELLGEGPVEIDEAFIGGKISNMHLNKRYKNGVPVKTDNKTPVIGMLDRGSREVRAKVIPNAKRETLQKEILEQVGFGSTVYTDGWKGYNGLKQAKFVHDTVSHMNEYVRGQVHTQGIENFWSCLKRTLNGTYVAVEPFHLDAYVDEQVFRFNNRNMKDAGRFNKAVGQVVGKRLTYAQVTGEECLR